MDITKLGASRNSSLTGLPKAMHLPHLYRLVNRAIDVGPPAGLHKKLSTGGTPSESIDMDMYIENIPQSTSCRLSA